MATVRDADDLIKEFRHYTATASMPVIKWVSQILHVQINKKASETTSQQANDVVISSFDVDARYGRRINVNINVYTWNSYMYKKNHGNEY